ncbi:hypothetical protein ABZ656_56610, partial [Streptomyces sp. NPDC007095]|uniref:hypothetical protein n=1 Tax=Streptomyces sp. NPDC007095 TaxID=3154482 RepID=UPI0033D85118
MRPSEPAHEHRTGSAEPETGFAETASQRGPLSPHEDALAEAARFQEWSGAKDEIVRTTEDRFTSEEQKAQQQERANEALDAAQEAYQQENIHGVPEPRAGNDPETVARRLGLPEELVEPVARAYRMAEVEHQLRSGGTDRPEGMPALLREELADESGAPVEAQAQPYESNRPADVEGTQYRRALIKHLSAEFYDFRDREHLPAAETVADGLLRQQARGAHEGPSWRQRVENRFNGRWQADLEELQGGRISRELFDERFGALSRALPDEFEIAAAADSARITAERFFDTARDRADFPPYDLPVAEQERVRAEFGEEAAAEVYKAAEGSRPEDGRMDLATWDEVRQKVNALIREWNQGLPTRGEEAAAEVYKAAEGSRPEDGRMDWATWDEVHRKAIALIREWNQGLPARLELEAAAEVYKAAEGSRPEDGRMDWATWDEVHRKA